MAKELRFDVSALDQASKTFTRMGQAVERFEKRLDRLDGKRVEAELGVKTDQAEREVGRFATDTQRKLAAALSNLPEVELDADSTPLDRKLVDIRRRMAELADKTIGVDLSADEAIAESQALKRELDELARTSPDIRVQVDAAAASAKLAEVGREVDRIDGRKATVTIDVDKSISETLIQVAQLGRALGALALPAGIVAAAPQLAALGAAALTTAGAVGLIPAAGFAAAAAVGTLALGFENFGDAVGDDPAKAAQALGKLSENARKTAVEVRALAPAWAALQLKTQDALFAGLGDKVKQLGGTYLPILGDATQRIAEHFNGAAQDISTFLQQSSTVATVQSLFSNLENTVEQLATTFAPLTAAVVDIAEVGSEVFVELTAGAEDAARAFMVFIAQARQSGELKAWIQGGVTAIGQLIRITGNLGSLLSSVFAAGEVASGDLLGNVERVTAAMADWAAQNPDLLVAVFRTINETVAALLPGIRDLGGAVLFAIAALGQSGTFQAFARALSSIMSAAAPLVAVLGALASLVLPPLLAGVSALAPVLVPLAAGLLGIRAASSGLNRLREFSSGLSEARTNVAGALSPMRQLSDQMRVQRTLARQAGESHRFLGGALAAMSSNQNAAIAGAGRLGTAMQASYRQASTSVAEFANRAGRAGNQATTALGERLAAGVSRGVEGVVSGVSRTVSALGRVPGAVAGAASTLRTGIGVAAITAGERLRDLGARARDTGQLIKTGIGVYALDAAAKLRQLPAAATSAASTLRAAVGVAALDAGQKLRTLGTNAAEAGRSLASGLQSGVASAVSTLRTLPTAAADAGRSLATGLRSGVTAAADSVRELPARVGSAMTATGQAVATGLRTIPDGVRTAFSALGSGVDTAIGHLGRLGGSVAGAARSLTTGLMRAGGSLVGFLGGPWGVALAAAGVALSILGERQAEAARKAQEHQAALDNLRGTLDAYSGAVTQATVNERASQYAKDGTLDSVKRLGLATNDYVRATLGEQDALDRVVPKLFDMTRAGIENSNAFKGNRDILDANGISLDTLTRAAMGYGPAQDEINNKFAVMGSAGPEAKASMDMLRDSLLGAGGDAAQLAQKLGLSVGEVRQMQEATRGAASASQDFQNSLKGLGPAMAGIKDGVAPTAALANGLRDLGGSAGLAAKNAGDAAAKLGGVDAGAKAARDSMQGSRDAFVQAAQGAGMTAEQAGALADKIGLIPPAAETNFRTNAQGVAAEMGTLTAQINAVPAGKDVQVQALTADARANLTAMGFQVENLPDGTFKITANTEAARANLEAFQRGAADRKAEVQIGANRAPAEQSLGAVLAAIAGGAATVTINGNDVPAQQALAFVLGAAQNSNATVTINGNATPANQTYQTLLGAVNSGQATVNINGQDYPARAVLDALNSTIREPVDKPVGADTSPAQAPLDALRGTALDPALKPVGADVSNGLTSVDILKDSASAGATKPVGADTGTGMSSVAGLQGSAQAGATKPVGANTGAGTNAVGGLQRSAQAPATKPVDADTGGARGAVSGFVRWVSGLVATVSVVASKIGFSGGAILPMADGGLVHRVVPLASGDAGDPDSFDGHRLTPMSAGSARIVAPRTYRVIGDRPSGDEAFIPLVPSSGWSQTLLEVSAARMGREMLPRGMKLAPTAGAAVVPMAQGGMVTAAQAILARMRSGQQLAEDWTWRGAPPVVGQYNDALLDAMERAGVRYTDGRRWLEDYVRRTASNAGARPAVPNVAAVRAQVQSAQTASAAARQVTVRTGMDVAELRSIHAQLVGLRGDLLASGRWGPEMVEQLRGLSNRMLSEFSATARAAAGRDIASGGMWP